MPILIVILFSLRRHIAAINILSDHGMHFWDYGNAFLLEASRAGWYHPLLSNGANIVGFI